MFTRAMVAGSVMGTARTERRRPFTWIAPCGFAVISLYQRPERPRTERTYTWLSTTTTPIVTRCILLVADRVSISISSLLVSWLSGGSSNCFGMKYSSSNVSSSQKRTRFSTAKGAGCTQHKCTDVTKKTTLSLLSSGKGCRVHRFSAPRARPL